MPTYKDKQRGTWFVKISTKDAVTGKRKQILKRGFETKRDAQKWEAQQRAEKTAASSVTFRKLSEKYFEYSNSRPHTREHQTAMLENHFPSMDHRADRISKNIVMEWYLDLTAKDLQPSTKNLILKVMKAIFKYGHDFYDMPNPAVGLKRFKEPKKEMVTWDPDEFRRVSECVELETYRLFFTFLYWTGCRKGEAQGLQYTDFSDDTVYIHQQWTQRRKLEPLKNDPSIRRLKLADTLRDEIRPLLERCDPDHPFIFGGVKPLSASTIKWQFDHATQEAGVKAITVHDLRHSFATNMINNDANIVAVSKYLVHANINTTLKTYTHLLARTNDKMIGLIDTMMK